MNNEIICTAKNTVYQVGLMKIGCDLNKKQFPLVILMGSNLFIKEIEF